MRQVTTVCCEVCCEGAVCTFTESLSDDVSRAPQYTERMHKPHGESRCKPAGFVKLNRWTCTQLARAAPSIPAITTRAEGLCDSWTRTQTQESLDSYVALVRDVRAYPQPKPADRALFEKLAGNLLAKPASA